MMKIIFKFGILLYLTKVSISKSIHEDPKGTGLAIASLLNNLSDKHNQRFQLIVEKDNYLEALADEIVKNCLWPLNIRKYEISKKLVYNGDASVVLLSRTHKNNLEYNETDFSTLR